MRKVILLSFVFLMAFQFSQAQCPVAPRYLNASAITDSGFTFVWNQLKPSCDSVFGFEIGIKPAGGKWAYYGLDSLTESEESDWPFQLGVPLTLGKKYAWKMRTWTDKGGISYSAWVTGKAFTVTNPVATGNCMPPSSLCLFTPGATTVTCIWDGTAGPWNAPTKYQFQRRTDPGGAWVSTVKPVVGGINETGLTHSTAYNWRVRFKCGTQNSDWMNGPDFATPASLAAGKDAVGVTGTIKPIQHLDAKNVKHEIDEDEAVVAANTLQLYPNPAKSALHVQMTPADAKSIATYGVILKDLSGRIFYSASSVNAAALKNLSIDVSRMPTGFYMLEIRGSDNSVTTSKVNVSRD